MSDLEFGIRVNADASGLVGQVGQGEAALDRLGATAGRTGASAQALGGATARAAGELDQAASAADRVAASQARAGASSGQAAAAQDVATASTGRMRAAYQQLSFQVSDVFTQLAAGTNPLLIFAQQGPQIAQAFSLMGGSAKEAASPIETVNEALGSAKETYENAAGAAETLAGAIGAHSSAETANTGATGANTAATGVNTGATNVNTGATNTNAAATTAATGAKARFAAMLTGPWGAAIIGGVSLLALLAGGLFSAEEQTKDTADATDIHKMSIDQLVEAIEAENAALQRSIQTGRAAELQAFATAFAKRIEAEDRLKAAEAALTEAEANRERALGNMGNPAAMVGGGGLNVEFNAASGEVSRLRSDIATLRGALTTARASVTAASVPLAQRAANARSDPAARIREDYDRAVERATARFQREADGSNPQRDAAAQRAYTDALTAAANTRTQSEEALRESRRQPRQRREREQPTPQEQMAAVLRAGGLSPAVVAGILGNIQHESGFNGRLVGDSGTAFGHAQWRHERVSNFQRELGVHPRNATAGQAGQFILWELANPGRAGMTAGQADQIRRAGTPEDAARLFDRFYERSNGRSRDARATAARGFFNNGLGSGDGGPEDAARALREMAEEADRLREFGSRAAASILDLTGQFDNTPPAVAAVRESVGRLDELLADIEEKRPPNYEQLIEQARAARPVIEDSINKPYRDFILAQQKSLEIAQLEAAGRSDEAQARQAILQLEREIGPLSVERKDAVLATVQALRAEERQLEINRKRQEAYLGAIGQARTLIRDTVADVLSGDAEAIADIPGALARSFNELVADTLTENLFGDTFRQLEDQVTGTRIVEDASERMSGAVDDVREDLRRFGQAVTGAAAAAEQASSMAAQGWGSNGAWDATFEAIGEHWTRGWDETFAAIAAAAGGENEMVVTGQRGGSDWPDGSMPTDGSEGFPRDPRAFFGNMLTELLEDAFGPRFAKMVGSTVSRGLEGAAYGSMVGGILRSAGVQVDGTGSAVGGAIGNVVGEELLKGVLTEAFGKAGGQFAGPIGSIAGSIIGGLIGNLISGPNKASATITSVDGPLNVTGKSGLKGAAGSLGDAVQQGIGRVAEALGGQLGAFSVSIGKRGESFRVDPLGRGQTKAAGVLAFDTEEAAVAAAILDAIKDGAVTGLSAAMQRALQSNSDIDKAVREALKVREVEELLAGVAGELNSMFREFESQAAERVRIARQYGFDVVKIEELNAKERAELVEQALESRVGRLQDLLDDLKFGELFEGSIVDRRQKLLAEIAGEEARAKAGEEGAADRVAELSRELIALTRSGFGTAGREFSDDRSRTIASAEEIIRVENARIKAAQDAALGTNEKLGVNNQLTNETNNLLAEQNAILRELGLLTDVPGGAAGGGGRYTTERKVEL